MLKNKIEKPIKSTIHSFAFKSKLWRHDGPAGWYFVTIPKATAKRIRSIHQNSEEGWGRLKTTASIGSSSWKTCIWFDTKTGSYLLPIKALIRKNEMLAIGLSVTGQLEFELDRWTLSLKNTFYK